MPTWELVLQVAKQLVLDGCSTFKLAQIVDGVKALDPGRRRTSIQPVVQGMTWKAGRGPQQPCGKVFRRTERGWYRFLTDAELEQVEEEKVLEWNGRAARFGPRPPRQARPDLKQRIAEVIEHFDELVEEYDRRVPFRRSGQYEFHRNTIDRRLELGSVRAATADPLSTELLHATLQRWGVGRRASRLVPLEQFRQRLIDLAPVIAALDGRCIEDDDLDVAGVSRAIDGLITELGVVTNRSKIVPGTKTLHHLLPELVPPMDRRYTGAFFGWSTLDPQNRQTEIFDEAFGAFAEIARAVKPSRLVDGGWRTSTTKLLDNAIVAYCLVHDIRPRG